MYLHYILTNGCFGLINSAYPLTYAVRNLLFSVDHLNFILAGVLNTIKIK